MRYYLEKEITNSYKEGSLVIDILSKEDFINQYQKENHANHVIRHIGDIMYCKVELFYDVICGAFVIPDKKDLKIKHCFSFYLTEQKMIFIDDNDYVMKLIEKMKDTYTNNRLSLNKFFHDLIFLITVDDGMYLQEYADRLQVIEDKIAFNFNSQINNEIILLRKELLILNSYYNQLGDIIDILSDNESDFLNDYECHLFSMQARRIDRLDNQLNALKDYSLQIKEMYQNKIDTHQNKIMTVLTVATTIFFPLSIITGWYGMNFKNMPELNNPYGYIIVIGASILVVIIEMLILKNKKFF